MAKRSPVLLLLPLNHHLETTDLFKYWIILFGIALVPGMNILQWDCLSHVQLLMLEAVEWLPDLFFVLSQDRLAWEGNVAWGVFSDTARCAEELVNAAYVKNPWDQIPFQCQKNVFEHVVNFYSCSINTDLDLLLLYWLSIKKIPHDKLGNKFDSWAVLRSCCHHGVVSPE